MQINIIPKLWIDLGPEGVFCLRNITLLDHGKTFIMNFVKRAPTVYRMIANINLAVMTAGERFWSVVVTHNQ